MMALVFYISNIYIFISILRTVFTKECDAFGKQRLRNTAEK